MLKALLGRNSLLGICRVFSISLTWSLPYITEIYGQLPADLNFQPVAKGAADDKKWAAGIVSAIASGLVGFLVGQGKK